MLWREGVMVVSVAAVGLCSGADVSLGIRAGGVVGAGDVTSLVFSTDETAGRLSGVACSKKSYLPIAVSCLRLAPTGSPDSIHRQSA